MLGRDTSQDEEKSLLTVEVEEKDVLPREVKSTVQIFTQDENSNNFNMEDEDLMERGQPNAMQTGKRNVHFIKETLCLEISVYGLNGVYMISITWFIRRRFI